MRASAVAIFLGAFLAAGDVMIDYASGGAISVGGIELDAAYAGFIRGEVTNNEKGNPGYGYTVAYLGHEGTATVYIYGKGQSDIPSDPTSQVVMGEFDQAIREIIALGRLTGSTIELVGRYGTISPKRGVEFLCAEFVLGDQSGLRRTFLYLTGAAKQFLKIRVTLRTNDAKNPAARRFADAVANSLWDKGSDLTPPTDNR